MTISELWDTHMHTAFSGDCDEAPEDMLKAAADRGIAGVIFTDHLDWDYKEEPHLFDLDLDGYFKKMTSLTNRYNTGNKNKTGGIKIGIGIELGLQEHLVQRHTKLLDTYDFDQVIGSIHVVNGVDPYYENFYKDKTVPEAYHCYFDAVYSNIQAFPCFDTLGHLDYIARYVQNIYGKEDGAFEYSNYSEQIDRILEFLISHQKSLEINTGAFRAGMDEPNPCYDIIRRYYEMGGRLITLGADAHHTEHVALRFEDVKEKLIETGFDGFYIYLKRKPVKISFALR